VEQGMAYIFDEEILRAPLRAMTPDERAQYALSFIELVVMPYGRHRECRDLYTAIITVADAISYGCSYQMTEQETRDFRAYLGKWGKPHA
jgi:hypothetical protein